MHTALVDLPGYDISGMRFRHLHVIRNYLQIRPCDNEARHAMLLAMQEVRSSGHVFLARMLPYRTPDDYSNGVELTFVDITARKEAEAGLRESEEKYRSLFDSMTEGFALCDLVRDAEGRVADWRFVEINQAWERQTGGDRAPAIGSTAHAIFTGLDSSWVEAITSVMDSGKPEHVEFYSTPIDRWFHATVFPLVLMLLLY